MSDFELPEERGWVVYVQNPRSGEWSMEKTLYGERKVLSGWESAYLTHESPKVEEVTIRPVALGIDPMHWAAVSVAASFLILLSDLYRFPPSDKASFHRWTTRHKDEFGGSLEREPAEDDDDDDEP